MDGHTVSIPSSDPSTYCRLCFTNGNWNLVPLFPTDSEPQQDLIEQILEFTGIQIKPRVDSLSHICWRCAVAMEDFQLFRQRSLAHDVVLRATCGVSSDFEDVVDVDAGTRPLLPTLVAQVEESVIEKPYESSGAAFEDDELLVIDSCTIKNEPLEDEAMSDDDSMLSDQNSDDDDSSCCVVEEEGKPAAEGVPCYICKTMFVTQHEMFKHFKENHHDLGRPYKCSRCPLAFRRPQHLKNHEACHRSGKFKFECGDCGGKFSEKKIYVRHRIQYHPAASSGHTTRGISCYVCKADFQTQQEMFKHFREQHFDPGRKHQCSYCPTRFRKKNALHDHEAGHLSGTLRYECKICGGKYSAAKTLLRHRQIDHPSSLKKKGPKST